MTKEQDFSRGTALPPRERSQGTQGAAAEVLSWPAGLSDATVLPFVYWRVMHLIDGRRSLGVVAAALNTTEEAVQQAVTEVKRWIQRMTVREQPMSSELQEAVTQQLMGIVGPMGRMMIDDALDDLPEQPTLSALLEALARQLGTQNAQTLLRQLRTRGIV